MEPAIFELLTRFQFCLTYQFSHYHHYHHHCYYYCNASQAMQTCKNRFLLQPFAIITFNIGKPLYFRWKALLAAVLTLVDPQGHLGLCHSKLYIDHI